MEEKKHILDVDLRSPSFNKEIEVKKIDLVIEEQKWRSCCFDIHSESSMFFAKIGVTIGVMTLCSYQLVMLNDCSNQSLYSSLLSSVITFWLVKK
jgi:hypothetical protein